MTAAPGRRGLFAAIGPAIIVAAVVLGPGSILTSSKVGAQFGYDLVWLLALAVALMIGTVALAGRLGVTLEGSLCDELTRRVGRPAAVIIGVTVFVIIACFQTSNNVAVLAALEPVLGDEHGVTALLVLNAVVIATLFGLQKLYRPVEKLMMLLVLAMIVGFAGNLWFARPSVGQTLAGLWPSWPADADVLSTMALVATTFSVAGAFYQAYLVREKGWSIDDHRRGLADSVAGIGTLGLVSLIIMVTAAATLHGTVDPAELRTAADVATQLEPLFGPKAVVLFSIGIFAGAFSSFLVNAMIGGVLLADGLGLGSRMDGPWPKVFTVAALSVGMIAAVAGDATGIGAVDLIVIAQSLTVIGVPLLACTLLFLATRADLTGDRRIPSWMKATGVVGLVVTIGLSVRTVLRLVG